MESRTDRFTDQTPIPDRVSRHIMLSKTRGVVTELEIVGAGPGSDDVYLIRYHKAAGDAGRIFEAGSWIGFRYHDSQWSFVEQADFCLSG